MHTPKPMKTKTKTIGKNTPSQNLQLIDFVSFATPNSLFVAQFLRFLRQFLEKNSVHVFLCAS